ncbi:MAG TPA: DUF6375 family protein [Pyrinomonadaceae bacterium]|jgi:hypothetical protein
MKIWRSYGSGHSAHLSIVGEFKSVEDAELVRQIVEDFVSADLENRYPNAEAFRQAWRSRFGDIVATPLAPDQSEYFLGIESPPDVLRRGTTVEVSEMNTTALNGIIKLMLLKYPTEIKITGETGP